MLCKNLYHACLDSLQYNFNSGCVSLLTNLAGNGVDYGTPNPSTFTFTAFQTIQCTNIPITDDALIEGPVDETFNITLTQTIPTDPEIRLAPTTAIVSIDDNDGKTLNSAQSKRDNFCNVFSTLNRLYRSCVVVH